MKIICLECNRELGEKFPFDDTRKTHTICRECIEQRLIEAGNEGLRGKFIRMFRREVSLKFDPEVDSLGVE
ncbi:MAG: hypothetical protein ACFFDT_05855 [Candidatus Hodarchaeota archaeon]